MHNGNIVTLSLATVSLLLSHSLRAEERPMMKAVVAHEYGAPEVLKLEQIPRPSRTKKKFWCA